jgi:hypothetical protein
MNEEIRERPRLAVLIDGDNVSYTVIQQVLAEAAKYGLVVIKRVYGDWSQQNMEGWRKVNEMYAFSAQHQFRIAGKNSTDVALIIDAMDLLYTENLQGFVLVSSDRDYTRLALRLVEKGKFVLGIGRRDTRKALQNACTKFAHIENIAPQAQQLSQAGKPSAPNHATKTVARAPDEETREQPERPLPTLLTEAWEAAAGGSEDGWVTLSAVGDQLSVLSPGFDPRSYGKRQLSKLVEESGLFEVRRKGDSDTAPIYVKLTKGRE